MAIGERRVGRGKAVQHGLEQEPFAHEAAQRRQGGDGQPADQEERAGDRHPSQQTTELVEVPGAGGLLDRAGTEEQRPFEHGVEDHVQQGGDQGHQGQGRWPVAANRPEAPTPSSMSPTLSVVE